MDMFPGKKMRNLSTSNCWKCIEIVNPATNTLILYHFEFFTIPSGGPFWLLGGGGGCLRTPRTPLAYGPVHYNLLVLTRFSRLLANCWYLLHFFLFLIFFFKLWVSLSLHFGKPVRHFVCSQPVQLIFLVCKLHCLGFIEALSSTNQFAVIFLCILLRQKPRNQRLSGKTSTFTYASFQLCQ